MKIKKVSFSNRRKGFAVVIGGRTLHYPFSKADPAPSSSNPILRLYVDRDLAAEGFTYVLSDGREGTIHVEQVLEYNKDPDYLLEVFMHKLTVEVRKLLEASGVPKREVVRRLHTSPSQLYRLLDEKRSSKSLPQLFAVLNMMDCDVDLVITRGRTRKVMDLTPA